MNVTAKQLREEIHRLMGALRQNLIQANGNGVVAAGSCIIKRALRQYLIHSRRNGLVAAGSVAQNAKNVSHKYQGEKTRERRRQERKEKKERRRRGRSRRSGRR